MPKVRVKDIEMYYEIHGTGAPLVHIGGLAISASIIRSSASTTEVLGVSLSGATIHERGSAMFMFQHW